MISRANYHPAGDRPCVEPECLEPRHVTSGGMLRTRCLPHVNSYNDGTLVRHMRAATPNYDTDLADTEKIYEKKRRQHGITPAEFQALLGSQNGVCKICHTNNPGLPNWSMDHDHKHCTGQYGCRLCVRGLLCASCNSMLAYGRDNPGNLEAGAAYLRQARQW